MISNWHLWNTNRFKDEMGQDFGKIIYLNIDWQNLKRIYNNEIFNVIIYFCDDNFVGLHNVWKTYL